MEDPFERTNTGRAVIDHGKFNKIMEAFDRAQRILFQNMCLDCLHYNCKSHKVTWNGRNTRY